MSSSIESIRQAQLERDAECMRQLRAVIGHVANSTDTTATITQDDATRDFILRVGTGSTQRSFYGSSLTIVIAAAYQEAPVENKA